MSTLATLKNKATAAKLMDLQTENDLRQTYYNELSEYYRYLTTDY